MPIEIERKFLVANDEWRKLASDGVLLRDGLMASGDWGKVRIRVAGDTAWITVKGRRNGLARPEFEYPVPVGDALAMFALCRGPVLEKMRYCVPHGDLVWEVDVYTGLLEGVVLAEVELESVDQTFDLPEWIGAEVTGDPKFRKLNMVAAALTVRGSIEA